MFLLKEYMLIVRVYLFNYLFYLFYFIIFFKLCSYKIYQQGLNAYANQQNDWPC